MAIQGATPRKIIPEIYSLAVCGLIKSTNKYSRNKTASAAIVKG